MASPHSTCSGDRDLFGGGGPVLGVAGLSPGLRPGGEIGRPPLRDRWPGSEPARPAALSGGP